MKLNSAIVLALLVLLVAPASAADLARGHQLAEQWCANCHVIGPATAGTTQQGPPSLQAVARDDKSADELRTFLTHPHGEMPDLSLSRIEIDDLIAYIQSLR